MGEKEERKKAEERARERQRERRKKYVLNGKSCLQGVPKRRRKAGFFYPL
jgi:hypothetical protein